MVKINLPQVPAAGLQGYQTDSLSQHLLWREDPLLRQSDIKRLLEENCLPHRWYNVFFKFKDCRRNYMRARFRRQFINLQASLLLYGLSTLSISGS